MLAVLFPQFVWIMKVLFGYNRYGELGLGHNTNQNVLNKIPNIPPIKIISCVRLSCYLIDLEGNLWSFGFNDYGQLGHGDRTHKNVPTIVNTLKDIQQISYGNGDHFFAKNSQNQIFTTGSNNHGQLGTGDKKSLSIPKELNSQYSTIWGNNQHITNRWKGRRETTTMMNWNEEEMKKDVVGIWTLLVIFLDTYFFFINICNFMCRFIIFNSQNQKTFL